MNTTKTFKNWKRSIASFLAFVMLLTLFPATTFKAETMTLYPEATLKKTGTDIMINLKDDFDIAVNTEVTLKELVADDGQKHVAFCYDITKHSVDGERYALVESEAIRGEEGVTLRRLLTFANQDPSVSEILGTTPWEWSANNYALAQCLIWGYQKGLSTEGIAQLIDKVLTVIDSNGWGVKSADDRSTYAMAFAEDAFSSNAVLGVLFVWRGSSSSQSLVSWIYKSRQEFSKEYLYREASYEAKEKVTLCIYKSDQDTAKPLEDVSFDLYKDNVKVATVTTDTNGKATYTFAESVTASATSSEYWYCDKGTPISAPNRELLESQGIYVSKAEAEKAALAEATAKAKAKAEQIFTEKHTYKAIETKTREEYYLNPDTSVSSQSTTLASGDGSLDITFYFSNVRQTGSITVTKEDEETGKPVAGAVYGLYAAEDIIHPDGKTGILWKKDALVNTFPATDDKGMAMLGELYLGKYYVQEISAPNGYLLNKNTFDVELSYLGQSVDVTYGSVLTSDTPVKGSIHVIKQDKELAFGKDHSIFDRDSNGAQGDATLAGAVYGLYTTEGTCLCTAQTNEDGELTFTDLSIGKYYVKEITPSEGYLLDETEYEAILAHDGVSETIDIEVYVYESVKKQAIDLLKLGQAEDSVVSKPLEEVEFTVKLESDVNRLGWDMAPAYDVIVTEENGMGSSLELPFGYYHVKETKTPANYIAGADFFVTIQEDSREHQSFSDNIIVNKEFSAILKVIKQDAETGEMIISDGTMFQIKALTDVTVNGKEFKSGQHIDIFDASDDTYHNSWTTDESGKIFLSKLGAGRYQLEEIKAPNGYLLDTVPVEFEISSDVIYELSADGSTPVITVIKSDYAVKGQIRIEKTGEVLIGYENGRFIYEERALANAEYEIRNEDGELMETLVTDENGTAISRVMPLGIYEVTEVKAPEGMVVNFQSQFIELEYEDQITELVFYDVSFVNSRQRVNLNLHKLDRDTRKSLQGAEFSLYAGEDILDYEGNIIVKKDEIIAVAESDKDGNIVFDADLPLDSSFYIQETKAPEGYTLTTSVYSFDTTYQGQEMEQFNITYDFYNDHIIKQTGDNFLWLISGGMMLAGLSAMGFAYRKRVQC